MNPHPAPSEYARLHELAENRRLELLGHAETCRECREVLAGHDPTAIFGVLALEPVPELSLARLSRDIEKAIDLAPRPSRWRAVASIAATLAASLMLAAFFGLQGLREATVRIAADSSERTVMSGRSLSLPGLPPLPLLPMTDSAPERGLELISSPGDADVVDFVLGETQIVMIFDSALDI